MCIPATKMAKRSTCIGKPSCSYLKRGEEVTSIGRIREGYQMTVLVLVYLLRVGAYSTRRIKLPRVEARICNARFFVGANRVPQKRHSRQKNGRRWYKLWPN